MFVCIKRDIKGKNVMLMGNGIIKLIDFGCAKRLKKNQSSNSIKQLLKSLKGILFNLFDKLIFQKMYIFVFNL